MKTLRDFIERMRDRPWRAGENDCALFCAAWLMECKGVDYAAPFRGAYASTDEGLKLVGSLKEYATECLGEPEGILTARKGDIAYRTTDGGETVGVVVGNRVACPSDKGLYFSVLTDWEMVFHV